jgi:hypothetical protein
LEWWLFALIFLMNLAENAASAIYTMKVVDRKPFISALIGCHIDLIGTFSIIAYTENWRYVLALYFGSFCGTYSATYIKRWKERRTRLKNLEKANLAKKMKQSTPAV